MGHTRTQTHTYIHIHTNTHKHSQTYVHVELRKTIVMLHGGGFVAGSLESHDYLARRTAHETGALVVSVDYRLAPEHPFPAGQVDVVTVLDLLASNAELNEAKVSQKQAKQTTNKQTNKETPHHLPIHGLRWKSVAVG